jgi:hypothetical protein
MEQSMMLYSVKYGKPEVYEEFCLNTYLYKEVERVEQLSFSSGGLIV